MLDNLARSEILRTFGVRAAKYEAAKVVGNWAFLPGLIIFPEARCPYCKAIIHSKSIWKVDKYYVRAQWRLLNGKLRKIPVDHPHVNGSGICMGGAKDPQTALFLGLNPGDSYYRDSQWVRWLLEEFDHTCGEGIRPRAISAVANFQEDEDKDCECCCAEHCTCA